MSFSTAPAQLEPRPGEKTGSGDRVLFSLEHILNFIQFVIENIFNVLPGQSFHFSAAAQAGSPRPPAPKALPKYSLTLFRLGDGSAAQHRGFPDPSEQGGQGNRSKLELALSLQIFAKRRQERKD